MAGDEFANLEVNKQVLHELTSTLHITISLNVISTEVMYTASCNKYATVEL